MGKYRSKEMFFCPYCHLGGWRRKGEYKQHIISAHPGKSIPETVTEMLPKWKGVKKTYLIRVVDDVLDETMCWVSKVVGEPKEISKEVYETLWVNRIYSGYARRERWTGVDVNGNIQIREMSCEVRDSDK